MEVAQGRTLVEEVGEAEEVGEVVATAPSKSKIR